MSFEPSPSAARSRKPFRLLVAGLAIAALSGGGYLLLAERLTAPPQDQARPAAAGTGAPNAMLLFTLNCAGCHQTSGEGVPAMFPPLAGSEWVTGDERVLANILLHGIEGEMTVRGVRYQGSMPGFWRLSDVELAAVATYARSTWSNRAPPVRPEVFAAQRARGERDRPLAGERGLQELARRAH